LRAYARTNHARPQAHFLVADLATAVAIASGKSSERGFRVTHHLSIDPCDATWRAGICGKPGSRRIVPPLALAEQLREANLLLLDLIKCALPWRLVGPPSHQRRTMTEPIPGEMIISNLDDELRL
jgi:hypothetical protein